ncbi:MAG: hypothetical protein ABIF18_01635 [archaeon]
MEKINIKRKSFLQKRIELLVTNERSYLNIPSSKILGQEFALKQWLCFSQNRMYDENNSHSNKASFLSYLVSFGEDVSNRIKNQPYLLFEKNYN